MIPPHCIVDDGYSCHPQDLGDGASDSGAEKFRSILNSISDGLIVMNRDLVVTFFNQTAERFLGRGLPDVLGKHLFDQAFPEAKGSVFEEQYRKALRQQQPVEFDTYFGVEPFDNWYRVRAYPFAEGLTVYFRVITQQKQAEQALELESKHNATVANLSRELISMKSMEDISLQVVIQAQFSTTSPTGFIGYVDVEQGKLLCSANHGLDRSKKQQMPHPLVFDLDSPFCRWASTQQEPLAVEDPGSDSRVPHFPQGHMPLDRFIISPAIANGQWVGQIILANAVQPYTSRDIALVEQLTSLYALAIQRVRAEIVLHEAHNALERRVKDRTAQLTAANEKLRFEMAEREEAEAARLRAEEDLATQQVLSMRSDRLRSLGQMAAGIAHELNQPLVGVRGLAEHLLLSSERGWQMGHEDAEERLSLILEQADRMSHIINHIRLFAREAVSRETQLVSPADLIHSAVSMIAEQFRSHGTKIITELEDSACAVQVNPFSLEEVLLNLLTNARDAVSSGGAGGSSSNNPAIVIRTETETGRQPVRALISVTDSGPGIPENILGRVFDPFFTTKEPQKGTGLGLSISKSIVEQFSGEIFIRSTPGTGTTVTVALPLAKESRERDRDLQTAEQTSGGG